jgi:lipopolysaccharide cholinephosphotransferase
VKGILDAVLRIASRPVPKALGKHRLHGAMTRFADRPGRGVVAVGGCYGYAKETLQRTWASDLAPRRFEDRDFLCSARIDEYLAHLYGDFMTFPPVEKRVNKHPVVELQLPEEFAVEGSLASDR